MSLERCKHLHCGQGATSSGERALGPALALTTLLILALHLFFLSQQSELYSFRAWGLCLHTGSPTPPPGVL